MATSPIISKIYTALVIDFETGGLECTHCACTQVAVQSVRFDTWQVLERFNSYISPYNKQEIGSTRRKVLRSRREIDQLQEGILMDYDKVALEYSAITMDMLRKHGKPLRNVALEVLAIAQRATLSKGPQCKPILIGQNIAFDVGFLQQMMAYAGLQKEFSQVFAGTSDFYGNFTPHYLDTLDLGRLALAHDPTVSSYKLELLCEKMGIELDDAHDAEADVSATLSLAAMCSTRMRNGLSIENPTYIKEKTRNHFKI